MFLNFALPCIVTEALNNQPPVLQSELLRVLGGPSIGDLRSRLIRLMDVHHGDTAEHTAIRDLLSYRLPSEGDEYTIREEWATIVEGHHR